MLDSAQLIGDSWHPIDHTGLFVLTDGASTGMTHLQQTGRAIASHARQDDPNGIPAGQFGHRVEQDINRGAVSVDRCSLDETAAAF